MLQPHERKGQAMVQLAERDPMIVYVVLDGDRPVGRVVAPTGEPILALGAGTVLLQRGAVPTPGGAA